MAFVFVSYVCLYSTYITPIYIIYRNVVDQSRKCGTLKTTSNPAYALVGVSTGTDLSVTNKTADEMPSPPFHQPLPATPLPVAPPTGGIVGVAREGGVYDNIPDQ